MKKKNFEIVFDVKALRKLIVYDQQSIKNLWGMMPPYYRHLLFSEKYSLMPLGYLLKRIAAIYRVGITVIDQPDARCDFSHYNASRRLITICSFPSEKKNAFLVRVFSHELAHFLQNKAVEHDSVQFHDWLYKDFGRVLTYERTAEKLAYYIYDFYFGMIHPLKAQSFSAYRSAKHQKFLKAWVDRFK